MAPGLTRSSATEGLLEAAGRFVAALEGVRRVTVAFSGGGDSTALLWALNAALRSAPATGLTLLAVTVDHGLRPGSAAEAEQAGAFARSLGIPHAVLRWSPPPGLSAIQAQARRARYGLLLRHALDHDADVIVTGHNADDQAETVAMRRSRGEGEGLSGMAGAVLLQGKLWAVRPLLGLSRGEIRAALSEQGLAWSEDPSNDNPRFERVRVRAAGMACAVEAALPDSGQRIAAARRQAAWLDRHATVRAATVATVGLDGLPLPDDPDAALALFKLSGAIGGKPHLPAREGRARVLQFLASRRPGRLTLGGTVFDCRATGLHLYREARNLPAVVLAPGERLVWDGRWSISNPGRFPVTVAATDRPELGIRQLVLGGVPEAIARRAVPAMPRLDPPNQPEGAQPTRQIAAHAEFLPAFELPLARWFATAFGASMPPPPPVSPEFLGLSADDLCSP